MAELTSEQVELWILMMKDVPFASAAQGMRQHIMTNKFPPTIAEIAQAQRQVEYERLRAETAAQFAEMDQNDQLAIDCPAHLVPRFLKSGVSD